MNRNIKDMKCLIIEDATDHIESARNALIDIGLKRHNIFPAEHEQNDFTSLLSHDNVYEVLLKMIKDQEIDFLLLDMAWKEGEIPPNTSGEKFLKYLEKEKCTRIPIIGYSKFYENEIRQSFLPLFYIKKESMNVAPEVVVESFKKDIRMEALVRICNGNQDMTQLQNTIQEQKYIINTFVEYIGSSDVDIKILKDELINKNLYEQLSEEVQNLLDKLIKTENKDIKITDSLKNALLSFMATNPQSSIVLTKIMQSFIGVN